MLIGQSLIAVPGSTTTYRTPWFARGGQGSTFVVQVLHASSGDCEMTVSFEEKNEEDSDTAATPVGSDATVNSDGTHSSTSVPTASGVKQLLRCILELEATGITTEWMHVRVDPPISQPN